MAVLRTPVGGDDHRGPLGETADQVEQQLTFGLRQGQIAQLAEDDEVQYAHIISNAPLLAVTGLGRELVDISSRNSRSASRLPTDASVWSQPRRSQWWHCPECQ